MAGVASSLLKLPHSFTLGQNSFILADCPPNRYDEVNKVFEETASTSDGVGLDEFPSRESLLQKIKSSLMVLIVEEENTRELAMVCLAYRSPLSRSEKPVYHSSYEIITKKFRGTGLGAVTYAFIGILLVSRLGCKGVVGRTSITGKGLVGIMKSPVTFAGTIPRSILMAGKGMVDDLVVVSPFDLRDKNPCEVPLMPFLEVSNLHPYGDVYFLPVNFRLNAGTFTLRPGVSEDVEFAERLLREAGESGQGFAIDEFKPNGQFNRAFFQKCHLAVVCDSNGSIIGAALFGLSSLVRTTTLETSHVYIVIDKAYRNRGIGQKLLEEMLTIIQSVGYQRIITDVFCYNHAALHICHKLNFLLTGSIPKCGYIKNHGNCASYIFAHQSNYMLKEGQYASKL